MKRMVFSQGMSPLKISFLGAFLACTVCRAAIVIPIEVEKGNVFAAARINGVDVRLGVDSGGGVVALKTATIAKVRATRAASSMQSTDVLGNTSEQALLTLDTLEIAGKVFVHVAAVNAGDYAAGTPGDGVIGRKLLNRFIVVYDYSARKVTLFAPEERRAVKRECRGERVRTIPDPEEIIVSLAKTDHGTMRMTWDTGATYSVVKKEIADRQRLPLDDVLYTSKRFTLGARDFGPLRLAAVDFRAPQNVDGFIGYNFFTDHVVCIDPFDRSVKVR